MAAAKPDDIKDAVVMMDVTSYLMKSMHLTAQQHGMLFLLTMTAYLNGGWLANDERALAATTKCTIRQWRKDSPTVAAFFDVTPERWTHKGDYIGKVRLIRENGGRLPQAEWRVIRDRIFKRDGFACTYCGAKPVDLHCDHVVPVSRGGANTDDNLTTACRPCNSSKHAKTPEEWREWLS